MPTLMQAGDEERQVIGQQAQDTLSLEAHHSESPLWLLLLHWQEACNCSICAEMVGVVVLYLTTIISMRC